MLNKLRFDKPLFFAIIALVFSGLLIFGSAALGVLSVNEVKFYSVIKSQFIFALLGGSISLFAGILMPLGDRAALVPGQRDAFSRGNPAGRAHA